MPELRDYQRKAVEALVGVRKGIVKAPAGSGKTFIGAAAIQRIAADPIRVAWIGHTLEQVQQAKTATGLFASENATIDFYCYASAPWIGEHDVAVFDECHHCPAEVFRKILDGFDGIRWGLSATPEREDDLKEDVFELLGPIVHTVEREALIAAGQLCQGKVIFIEANEFDEYEEIVSEIADTLIEERRKKWPFLFANPASANEQVRRCTWQACSQEAIYNNPKRDAAIVAVANRHEDETVLIIVGSIEHGERLLEQIPDAEICHAKLGKKKRAEIMRRFSTGELKKLVATSLADEGLDVPRASVLVLAAGGKSSAKAEQRTGRVLRTFEEKTHGTIYDFNDHQHSYLRSQAAKRLKTYEKLGYEIAVELFDSPFENSEEKDLNEPEPAVSDIGYTLLEDTMPDAKTELKYSERKHSRHSPSSLEPILRCAGFLNDPTGDKTFADRGSLGHEATEKKNPDLCKDDESLRKAVTLCIKYTDKLEKDADKVLVEQRVKILDQSGSFDRLIVKGNEAHLVDYKFAYNKYAPDSMQFKAYAVGVFDAYPSILQITVHAVHPFLGEVYTENFTRGDYDYLVAEVRAVIERARKADQSEFRINKYCGYCGRAGSCPVLGKLAKELAERYTGDEYTLPEGTFDVHGSDFKDPAKAAALLRLAGPVEKAAESWRRGAMRLRIEEGVDIPGFKLVTAKGKRTVTNAPAAYEAIKDVITPEEFIQVSSISIGKLEDIYGSKAPKGKKAAFVAELNDKLADASAISEGAAVHKLVQEKGTAA